MFSGCIDSCAQLAQVLLCTNDSVGSKMPATLPPCLQESKFDLRNCSGSKIHGWSWSGNKRSTTCHSKDNAVSKSPLKGHDLNVCKAAECRQATRATSSTN